MSKNTRTRKGGRMMMDFNKAVIPVYSPISNKGGSRRRFRKNKSNKSRSRRRR